MIRIITQVRNSYEARVSNYKPLCLSPKLIVKKEIEWKNSLPTRIGKAMKVVLARNILRAARTNITPILSINLKLQLIRI